MNEFDKELEYNSRWVHLVFGFGISFYFATITFSGDTGYWNELPGVTISSQLQS